MGGELFSLFAKLTLDTSEFDKKTQESTEKAGVFGDVLKAELVGKGITAAIDGVKKLTGTVKDFTTSAVNSYGEVEQLRGGVETLFGDSAQKVLEDASEAFMSAGMNAADYMETSIQSAASLINSLGGDQAKAADLMNMSITDMADNVNKMGTSMEAVQNAYRGFSRGNFTMLDNLALGFAGTKDGMQQLLEKAEQVKASQGEMVDYSIDSYADMVEAIHVVQTEMGITGTTSKEASGTIQGSLNAMKSAWDNLVAGIADPEANIGYLVSDVVDTAEIAMDNLLPAVKRGLGGLAQMVSQLAPDIVKEIPYLIGEIVPMAGEVAGAFADAIGEAFGEVDLTGFVLPMLVGISDTIKEKAGELTEVGAEFLSGLGEGILASADTLGEPFSQILTNLVTTITENAPTLIEAAGTLLSTLSSGFAQALPNFLQNTALPLLTQLTESLRTNAGTLVDAGIDFILNLAQGIMNSLPTLLEQLPQIVINIAGVINDNAPKLIAGGIKLIEMIIKGIVGAIPALIENFPKIFEAILSVWSAFNWANLGSKAITFIRNGIKTLATQIPNAVREIGKNAFNFFKSINWATAGSDAITFILNGITSLVSSIPEALLGIGRSAMAAFGEIDWFSVGSNVINGIVNGISSNVGAIMDAARDAARDALNAAKRFLGIESPSKVFRHQVGDMIAQGWALGIEDGGNLIDRAINDISDRATKGIDLDVKPMDIGLQMVSARGSESGGKTVNNIFNIRVDGAESPEDYASRLVAQLELELRTA